MVRHRRREAAAPALAGKLCSCIKKVRRTVKLRKSSRRKYMSKEELKEAREAAAIGICVKSVVQRKEQRRTLRRFTCKNGTGPRLITQESLQ